MKVLLLVLCCVLVVSLVKGRSAIRSHQAANEEEYMPHINAGSEYDHEAFLGNEKAAFDELSGEEAKARLKKLIPRVDENGDDLVSADELYDWIKKQLLKYIMQDARGLHDGNDVNKDGFVSWKEYVATTYGLGFVDNEQKPPKDGEFDYRDLILRDYNKFITADTNGDQFLSVEEMGAFVHPEEFHHTRHLAVEETMSDLDRNKDGKVSLDEYINDLLADEEDRPSHVNDPEWLMLEKKEFLEKRDKDGDGMLNIEELGKWLQPENKSSGMLEAEHLIRVADMDKDGLLSRDEITRNYQVFVGSQATDYGRMLHKEL